uniref:Uncharacterized protein n=1 Tax=Parascaris equorum TaxID=6256 RepID=A0A914R2X0_PAREQ
MKTPLVDGEGFPPVYSPPSPPHTLWISFRCSNSSFL